MDVLPAKEIALVNETAVFIVFKVPDKMTPPPPLCVKAPVIDVFEPAVRVKAPEFVRVRGPLLVVIMSPIIVIAAPVTEIPLIVLVFSEPNLELTELVV